MTKKDFIVLVPITKQLMKRFKSDDVIYFIAHELSKAYPNFNKTRFIEACEKEEK